MKWEITDKSLESDFVERVEQISGEDISSCYQCGNCAAGCPICADMEESPTQVIRYVQLGLKEQALSNDTIWLCASCQTCTTRCPLKVDLAKIMDALRLISYKEDLQKTTTGRSFMKDLLMRAGQGVAKTLEVDIKTSLRVFSQVFLKTIRDYGRMSEMNLIANYNINSGNLLSNMDNAPAFLLKGKLALSGGDKKRIAKARRIFEKVEEIEGIKL